MNYFKSFQHLFFIMFFTGFVALNVQCSNSQPPEPDKAEKQNQRLGRGINLGNALEAPSLGEWGVELKEEYFEMISEKGFHSVRIPIRWNAHTKQEEPHQIKESFFETVDWAIENSLENGLYVVINFHHYEPLYEAPEEEKERFLALWEQVSERYRGYPDSLLFEILNEPHGNLTAEKWNSLLKEAHQVIRDRHPERTLIVGTAEYGGVGGLNKLELPPDDNNIILTVHYYNPFHFTHQGAGWVDGSDEWLDTQWNNTPEEREKVKEDLEAVISYSEKHDVPVYMGEFGAYSKAPMDSRVRWTNYCARLFKEKGFSWAYWEFCSGFGIYNPDDKTWNQDLVDALLPKPMPEPSEK